MSARLHEVPEGPPASPSGSTVVSSVISPEEVARFREEGFLLVKGFYDFERDIVPIQRGVHAVIGLLRKKNGLAPTGDFSPSTFDEGYLDLIKANRDWGGEVYDAIKQIPAFVRLVSSARNEILFRQLRNTEAVGIAAGGYGIRIDNPNEERYRADWHQEYHSQLRSQDGITFWTSLVPLSENMGPVRFCVGSHKGGLLRVHTSDPTNPDKTGAYGLILENRERVVAGYTQAAPLPQAGDLVLIDYAVLHCSGFNISERARWSAQIRYFNFYDPTGVQIGWKGSFAAGQHFGTIHPELVVRPSGDK
jgi:hypothetical protein